MYGIRIAMKCESSLHVLPSNYLCHFVIPTYAFVKISCRDFQLLVACCKRLRDNFNVIFRAKYFNIGFRSHEVLHCLQDCIKMKNGYSRLQSSVQSDIGHFRAQITYDVLLNKPSMINALLHHSFPIVLKVCACEGREP